MSDVSSLQPGLPVDLSTLTFDLPTIFREAVDLAESLANIRHDMTELPGNADVLRARLICVLNPRNRKLSPYPRYPSNAGERDILPGWGQEVTYSPHLGSDARRALIAIALIAAELGNDHVQGVWQTRELLPFAVITLWVGMTDEQQASARRAGEKALVVFKREKLPTISSSILIDFSTPGFVIDALNWRTVSNCPAMPGPCLEHAVAMRLDHQPCHSEDDTDNSVAAHGVSKENGKNDGLPEDIARLLQEQDRMLAETLRRNQREQERFESRRRIDNLRERVRGRLDFLTRITRGEGHAVFSEALRDFGDCWREYQTEAIAIFRRALPGIASVETTFDLVQRVSTDERLPPSARLFLRIMANAFSNPAQIGQVIETLIVHQANQFQGAMQWLPFFRDHLFPPQPDQTGIIHVAGTPFNLTREEDDAVHAALGFTNQTMIRIFEPHPGATQCQPSGRDEAIASSQENQIQDEKEQVVNDLTDVKAEKEKAGSLSNLANESAGTEIPIGEGLGQSHEVDGPQPPDAFAWRGKRVVLTKTPWKLLERMWSPKQASHDPRPVHIEHLEKIWDEVPSQSAVKGAINKINQRLKDVYPFRIEWNNSYLRWVQAES